MILTLGFAEDTLLNITRRLEDAGAIVEQQRPDMNTPKNAFKVKVFFPQGSLKQASLLRQIKQERHEYAKETYDKVKA